MLYKKKNFWIIFLPLVALLFMTIGAKAVTSILVYPRVLEIDFTQGNKKFLSKAITVENPSDEPIRIRAYTESWSVDGDSNVVFFKEPDAHSLTNYIKFNPTEFDLPPKGKQIVRMTVKSPESLADGEYRAMILFETVSDKSSLLNPGKSLSIGFNFVTRFGVAVYAYIGKTSKDPVLEGFSFSNNANNKPALIATIENKGNIHTSFTGTVELFKKGMNESIYKQPPTKFSVMPNCKQNYTFYLTDLQGIEPGNYIAKLKLTYKTVDQKEEVLEGETDFNYDLAGNTIRNELEIDESQLNKPSDEPNPLDLETEIKLNPNSKI